VSGIDILTRIDIKNRKVLFIVKWEDYISEIELIKKQNNVEYDLYTVIANVLRERKTFKNTSLRFVGERKRTASAKEKVFWALRGFPDFVILGKDYEPAENDTDRKLVYGAVEAKAVGRPILESKNDQLQFIGHLLWFGKVIYTNGLDWYFYENTWVVDEEEITRMQEISYNKYAKKPKNVEEDKEINAYLNRFKIADLKCKPFILYKEHNGQKIWDIKEWEKLIKYLDKYDLVSSVKQ